MASERVQRQTDRLLDEAEPAIAEHSWSLARDRAQSVLAIDPEKEHWHGAAPGTEGEHLAINIGEVTTWLESSA